jgi:hypothetical protein
VTGTSGNDGPKRPSYVCPSRRLRRSQAISPRARPTLVATPGEARPPTMASPAIRPRGPGASARPSLRGPPRAPCAARRTAATSGRPPEPGAFARVSRRPPGDRSWRRVPFPWANGREQEATEVQENSEKRQKGPLGPWKKRMRLPPRRPHRVESRKVTVGSLFACSALGSAQGLSQKGSGPLEPSRVAQIACLSGPRKRQEASAHLPCLRHTDSRAIGATRVLQYRWTHSTRSRGWPR